MNAANTSEAGFLVVLSDVKSENERDYLNWLTTEHVQERLGIPGFLAVRIFRRPIDAGHRYFIWYRLDNADVVDSAAYVERLNNPTPWSRRIMPVLGNFGRGGGHVAASTGSEAGAYIMAAGITDTPLNPSGTLAAFEAMSEIASAHLLVTDMKKSEVRTNERDLRTNNRSFAAVLIIESDSEKALDEAAAVVLPAAPSKGDLIGGRYREIFALAK